MEKSDYLTTIRNILTLRYDPTQNTPLQNLKASDFAGKKELSVDVIEDIMEKYVAEKLQNLKIRKLIVALSGGVDSTLVLALLKKKFPQLEVQTISVKFSESIDESQRAAEVSDFFGVKHHIIYLENYLEELPAAISIIGLPFWDVHWYYTIKNAKKISDFVASGDGGDELFGGYTFRYWRFLSMVSENSTPQDRVKAYLQCHLRDYVEDQGDVFGKNCRFSWDDIYRYLIPYFDNSLEPLEQVFLADYNGKLCYNFAIVNTKIHNYFEVHNITPILSQKMVRYSTSLAATQKYDHTTNTGKIPLRRLLAKFGADKFVLNEKLGFSVNTENLWKRYAKDICKYYLQDSRAAKDQIINHSWIKKYLNEDLQVRQVNKFLGLLAVEIWYRLFVTKELKPNVKL